MRLLKIMATTFAGLLLASQAIAQDGPRNWSGFYIGVTGGGGWTTTSQANTSVMFNPTSYFASSSVGQINQTGAQTLQGGGGTIGGLAAFRQQFNQFVVGLETDFSYFGMTTSSTTNATYPCCAPTGFNIATNLRTDWLWTIRPTFGVAFDKWLFSATGGLALSQLNVAWTFRDTFANAFEQGSVAQTNVGWTAGFSVERDIGWGLSVKAEYLYIDLGSVYTQSNNLQAFSPPVSFAGNQFAHYATMRQNLVRIGANYKF